MIPRDLNKPYVRPTPHPGEFLREDYMPEYGLTAGALAKRMGIARARVERIVREQQGVTADTALRLARVFGKSERYWLDLQTLHDLTTALVTMREELAAIEPVVAAA